MQPVASSDAGQWHRSRVLGLELRSRRQARGTVLVLRDPRTGEETDGALEEAERPEADRGARFAGSQSAGETRRRRAANAAQQEASAAQQEASAAKQEASAAKQAASAAKQAASAAKQAENAAKQAASVADERVRALEEQLRALTARTTPGPARPLAGMPRHSAIPSAGHDLWIGAGLRVDSFLELSIRPAIAGLAIDAA